MRLFNEITDFFSSVDDSILKQGQKLYKNERPPLDELNGNQ